jgi:hypothetical protein
MKPTQEQIEAALRYMEWSENRDDTMILDALRYKCEDWEQVAFRIIATAYRELLEENNRLKPWADLAISSNALLAIEKLKAHEPR